MKTIPKTDLQFLSFEKGEACQSISIMMLRGKIGLRGRPFNSGGGGGVDDFEKKFPASACRKVKIACSTNVIESLWEKKGKKYPAHQITRKKNS